MPELEIEVVYARPEQQTLVSVTVPPGSSVATVIDASGVEALYPNERFGELEVGIWGRVVDRGRVVVAGDRVELYRPLQLEPREARRQLALAGRTMGSADRD